MFQKTYGKAIRLADLREVNIVKIGECQSFYVCSPYHNEPSISITGPYNMNDKRFGSIQFESNRLPN